MRTPSRSSKNAGLPLRLAVLGCLIAGALTVDAQDPPKKKTSASSLTAKQKATGTPTQKTVMVTGSRIPRRVQPGKASTSTELTLSIVDKETIDRMGATSLREVLQKQAFAR